MLKYHDLARNLNRLRGKCFAKAHSVRPPAKKETSNSQIQAHLRPPRSKNTQKLYILVGCLQLPVIVLARLLHHSFGAQGIPDVCEFAER